MKILLKIIFYSQGANKPTLHKIHTLLFQNATIHNPKEIVLANVYDLMHIY